MLVLGRLVRSSTAGHLVRDVKTEVVREHVGLIPFASPHTPSPTAHMSKSDVKLLLVAAIIEEVRMENGIEHGAAKHAVPTPHTTHTAQRLHEIEEGCRDEIEAHVVQPTTIGNDLLRVTPTIRGDVVLLPEGPELAAIHANAQLKLVRRNGIPATRKKRSPHVQLLAVVGAVTLHETFVVSVREEGKEQHDVGVTQHGAVALEVRVERGGEEHVDVNKEVVRGGDGFDGEVAEKVEWVHALRVLTHRPLALAIVRDVVQRDGLLDVEGEHDATRGQEGSDARGELPHLRFGDEDRDANRTLPALQKVRHAIETR